MVLVVVVEVREKGGFLKQWSGSWIWKKVGVEMKRKGHVCVICCWEKEGFNGAVKKEGRIEGN